VKAVAFAGPYCGGHSFSDAFRHQERSGKLMFCRVHNNNDPVPYMPFNFRIGGRGCMWRHIGLGVVLPPIPMFRRWKPRVTYFGKEQSWLSSTCRAYRNNLLFHFPWWQAWNFAKMHTLFELQDRLMYGTDQEKAGGDFRLLTKTFEELYEELDENDYCTLKKKTRTSTKATS
jgi:Lipase (class 3)